MSDIKKIQEVLDANKDRNFVQRILEPKKYPYMLLPSGEKATHLMSWAEADGKYYVYPNIHFDGRKLTDYGPKQGFDRAMETGEFIEFKSPQEADWFSQNYKKVWDK